MFFISKGVRDRAKWTKKFRDRARLLKIWNRAHCQIARLIYTSIFFIFIFSLIPDIQTGNKAEQNNEITPGIYQFEKILKIRIYVLKKCDHNFDTRRIHSLEPINAKEYRYQLNSGPSSVNTKIER